MDCSNSEEEHPSSDEGEVDSQHEEDGEHEGDCELEPTSIDEGGVDSQHDEDGEHEGDCELEEDPVAKKRKSYSRETKLAAIQYYRECKNKYRTAKKKSSTLRGWLKQEEKIKKSHRGTRKAGCGRKAFWPDMEEELFRQYRELRDKGLKVKFWWFRSKSKDLMKEMHPDVEFKFSDGWFTAFKKRQSISYRSTTNVSQKTPNDYEDIIREFHKKIRSLARKGEKKGPLGQYELRDIGNMDQTPLPFTFNGGKGYDNTGTKTVWHCGAASGLEKRQCTAQLTVFANGESLKPLVLFRGKGMMVELLCGSR